MLKYILCYRFGPEGALQPRSFQSSYALGCCFLEAHAVSYKLTHGMEEKKKIKINAISIFGFQMVALWLRFGLCETGLMILNDKASWHTYDIEEVEGASEKAAALALKRDVSLGERFSPLLRPLGLFCGTYPNSSYAAHSGRLLMQ